MTRYYMVKYIRRPRVARAWGRKTKVHIFYLVFDTPEDAWTVLRGRRRDKHFRDSVKFEYTVDSPSGVSVEEAQRGLYRWKRVK